MQPRSHDVVAALLQRREAVLQRALVSYGKPWEATASHTCSVEIISNVDGDPNKIVVLEARSVEQIAVEIFERADPRFLQIWDFSDDSDGVHGSFRITASNGEWTYRFVRKCWWLDGVYEAVLALGEPLEHHVSTSSQP